MGSHKTILLIEDDQPIRERLANSLTVHPGFTILQAGTLAEARRALEANSIALIISDMRLPDGLALELLAEVRDRSPEIEILVISVLADETTIIKAIAAGASGYLLKDALPEDIRATVQEVFDGGSPISPSIARYIVRQARKAAQSDAQGTAGLPAASTPARAPADQNSPALTGEPAPRLTPRELDILWGIAKGLTYSEIADQLGMSRNTVPSHIKAIYRKLQVGTRGEAVYEAIQHGLIKL